MKKTNIILVSSIALLALAITAGPLWATTINVRTDYTTIQAAINAASTGDTILVEEGWYNEKILLNGYPYPDHITIKASGSAENTVIYWYGMLLGSRGIVTTYSMYTELRGFTIQGVRDMVTTTYVVRVLGTYCTIADNIIKNSNTIAGIGIEVVATGYCNIINNTVTDNVYGIELISAHQNNLTGNNVSGNDLCGVRLEESNDNNITNNTIANTDGQGIAIMLIEENNDDPSTGNEINYNNIYGSTNKGVYKDHTPSVDAEYNWWGDASGPDGEGPGSGDSVSTNVDYTPWLDDSVVNFKKVATTDLTSIGPSGGQVKVTISVGGDASNYLDVYQVGSLSGAPVTGETFPAGSDVNRRSSIAWGLVETGAVTADLVFDYSSIQGFDNSNSQVKLLKRTNAQSNWVDITSQFTHNAGAETFSKTAVTDFSEYAIADDHIPVYADIMSFLEAPYNVDGNIMSCNLTLPTVSPYDSEDIGTLPTVSGHSLIDWVQIQLRETTSGSTVKSANAFLLENGSVVDVNGNSSLPFYNTTGNDYYIVIHNRNHLDIMTTTTKAFGDTPETATIVDLTNSSNVYGTGGVIELETGVYGMIAGETNDDGIISTADKGLINDHNGNLVYDKADTNDDGIVSTADIGKVNDNNGKLTQVP